MDIELLSGILRRVALTKNGDLDISLRFTGKPDAGFDMAQFHTLIAAWELGDLLDVTVKDASDSNPPA